jgi:hypothetical protein
MRNPELLVQSFRFFTAKYYAKLFTLLATPNRAAPSYSVRTSQGEGTTMLWTIFAILLILWLLGFSFHVAGSLIHLLLVVAVIVLIVNLITGRSTAV